MNILTKLDKIKRRRAKWVKALRSGKYAQTGGSLHGTDGGHCCLGVADIVCRLKEESGGNLGTENRRKMGLTDSQVMKCIRANDRDRKDFKPIADMIEKMPIYKKVLKP